MGSKRNQLRKQIHGLEKKIKEAQKRLPAHSAKPSQVMELLDLEDEHELLLEKLKKLERESAVGENASS